MSGEIRKDKMVQARGPHGEKELAMQIYWSESSMGYSLTALDLEGRVMSREYSKILIRLA